MSGEQQFKDACEIMRAKLGPVVKQYPEESVTLYGLYKQATVGDNNTPRPWMIQIEASQKWYAWDKYRGMTPQEAKRLYVLTALDVVSKLS